MADYIKKKKSIGDNLAVVAEPISDSDLAFRLLSGLGYDYEAFITSMTMRLDLLSTDDLTSYLLSQENRLEDAKFTKAIPSAHTTYKTTYQPSNNSY